MKAGRWQEIKELYQSAVDREPGRREAFLKIACASNDTLRKEVESLLACQPEAEAFLESPAMELAAKALVEDQVKEPPVELTGRNLAHYQIAEQIGEGGMGVVYRARDTHLDRSVAIKVLPAGALADKERMRRFMQEARAASALNHPNIVTVHDISAAVPSGPAQATPVDFTVMELVDGRSLDQLIAGGPLPMGEALGYAVQIAAALAAAHAAGIVHRDIKPANIMVTGGPSEPGQIKVLDFGLAKLSEHDDPSADEQTPVTRTETGTILGTVAYMSPEQAEGKEVDPRTDVFSFGCVLYEMLSGRRPFPGDSKLAALASILYRQPAPLKKLRPDTPAQLQDILARALEKDRDRRYPSAVELWKDLLACRSRLMAPRLRSLVRKPQVGIPALLLLAAALAAGAWFAMRNYRAHWARNVVLPEIARLSPQRESAVQAYWLARQAQRYVPDDPWLQQLWRDVTAPITVRTSPPGALVEWKDYRAAEDSGWERLGVSPISEKRVPNGYLRWRISKKGFDALEVAFSSWTTSAVQFRLDPQGSTPPGMVRVPGGRHQFGTAPRVQIENYWLDRFEVTNRQFKEFIDAGSYRKREYWRHSFFRDGQELSWDQAMKEFHDATGREGPSTWEFGMYPDGQADFPVGGVSWYEADAYACFKGKSLPTVYHWHKAADVGIFSDIRRLSNFGSGPSRVGSFRGMSPSGAYDMAGNVKEWCWNQSGSRRYILGGSWGEPTYMFADPDALPPIYRLATYGFRCAKYAGPLPDLVTAPVAEARRDFSKAKPVNDETYQLYQKVYSYDPAPLNARIESVDGSFQHWRKERITFQAAYGDERVISYLFLPKNATPPYQAIVHFPGGYAVRSRSSEDLSTQFMDFILRSGRAVMYPIYKGTYERGGALPFGGTSTQRDLSIQRSRDLRRAVDYLETRQDIDKGKLAFHGFSFGARLGPIFMALEPRFKASVLVAGGFPSPHQPAEADEVNFAPRAKTPVLMVNGRHDFLYPLETAQKPLFSLLGAPEKDKRHVLLDSGHFPFPMQDAIREILNWLDRYMGPVRTK